VNQGQRSEKNRTKWLLVKRCKEDGVAREDELGVWRMCLLLAGTSGGGGSAASGE
jgi:hypothetical protein